MNGELSPQRSKKLADIARMYYLRHLTMDEIARRSGTSRSTVSRWLSQARELGLVQVTVHDSVLSPARLEQKIAELYRVRAVVAPIGSSTSDTEALEATAALAARTLAHEMQPGCILGVAWGSTISALSRYLPPKKVADVTVVQLNGAGNTHSSGIVYTTEILRRFGQSFGARVEQFPVPAFFDSAKTRLAMWQESSVQRIIELQRRMSIALFGIGALHAHIPSHVYAGGYLDEESIQELRQAGIAGDIATRFFRSDGSWKEIPMNERSSGPEFPDLLQVPRRICVVSSVEKIPGVRAALAGGLMTDLILDSRAATHLIDIQTAHTSPLLSP